MLLLASLLALPCIAAQHGPPHHHHPRRKLLIGDARAAAAAAAADADAADAADANAADAAAAAEPAAAGDASPPPGRLAFARTGAELVSLLCEQQDVGTIVLASDVTTLSPKVFDAYGLDSPCEVRRDVDVAGAAAPANAADAAPPSATALSSGPGRDPVRVYSARPLLDFGYTAQRVRLAPGVSLTLRDLAVSRTRYGAGIAIDLLVHSPRASVREEGLVVLRLACSQSLAKDPASAPGYERPPGLGGGGAQRLVPVRKPVCAAWPLGAEMARLAGGGDEGEVAAAPRLGGDPFRLAPRATNTVPFCRAVGAECGSADAARRAADANRAAAGAAAAAAARAPAANGSALAAPGYPPRPPRPRRRRQRRAPSRCALRAAPRNSTTLAFWPRPTPRTPP